MTYQPHPIDTSAVRVPPELDGLLDELAKNVHEVWAERRLSEGWRYGPQRDDAAKRHPCLVPFEELPESEKEYDRAVVNSVVKSVLAMGYRIVGEGEEEP